MADVKIIDIDGEQWNIKDQESRSKDIEQDAKIQSLTSEIALANKSLQRFYYDANVDREVLQNRIDAMIYCYNNSKSGTATIRYYSGYYYNVIIPSVDLNIIPIFVEITHDGKINIFKIKNSTDYELVRSI